ncbi:MAG: ATP-binding cassette domain-containing protein [Limisphaerales bacterium]
MEKISEQNPDAPILEMLEVALASPQNPEEPILENINWRVQRGDYWVVAGLHGSGKSDLIFTAAGLQNPLRGTVNLFGRDISHLKEKDLLRERLRIGVVFENGGRIFDRLTVAENIALPLRYHENGAPAEIEQRVQEILELTDLTSLSENMPSAISPSWQQRVGLARALALQPEILLLDKPFMGLELRHRKWWLDFLADLSHGISFTKNQPLTLVVTTDDLPLWMQQGNQFAVLKKKRWQVLGGRAELKDKQLLPDFELENE